MNLSREFTQEVDGNTINFRATYNPATHAFSVVENGELSYELIFNMENRDWKTSGGSEPSIPVDQLAQRVQQSFGVFV